jgi:hypothetical protein
MRKWWLFLRTIFTAEKVWKKLTPSQKRVANQSKKKGTKQYVPYPKSINKVMRRSKVY